MQRAAWACSPPASCQVSTPRRRPSGTPPSSVSLTVWPGCRCRRELSPHHPLTLWDRGSDGEGDPSPAGSRGRPEVCLFQPCRARQTEAVTAGRLAVTRGPCWTCTGFVQRGGTCLPAKFQAHTGSPCRHRDQGTGSSFPGVSVTLPCSFSTDAAPLTVVPFRATSWSARQRWDSPEAPLQLPHTQSSLSSG